MCTVSVINGSSYIQDNIEKPEIPRHIIVSASRRLSWLIRAVTGEGGDGKGESSEAPSSPHLFYSKFICSRLKKRRKPRVKGFFIFFTVLSFFSLSLLDDQRPKQVLRPSRLRDFTTATKAGPAPKQVERLYLRPKQVERL